MFKKTVLFVPDFWYSDNDKELLEKLIEIIDSKCGLILLVYPSNKSTDKPFTVSPKGKMEIIDPFQ